MFRHFPRLQPFQAMLAQFFGFGIAAGLWAGSVPTVARSAHMGTADIGLAFTFFTAAYIVGMTAGGKILSFAPPRRIILVGLPVNAIALCGLLLAHDALAVTISLSLTGLVMGLLDLAMNTEGTLVEADMRRQILARLHSGYSIGAGVGALAGSAFALTLGTGASVVLLLGVLGAAFCAVLAGTPDRLLVARQPRGIRGLFSLALLSIAIVFGISSAGETAASIWSARLLEEQAPRLAVIAGIGVSFFAVCQACVRFFGDRLRRALGDRRLVAASLVVAAIGFAIVGISPGFGVSVIGFAFVGVGTAMLAPCLFALSAEGRGADGGAAISLVAAIAGIPRLVAPSAFGYIAMQTSTGIAFGTIAVAFLLAFGLAVVQQPGYRPTT